MPYRIVDLDSDQPDLIHGAAVLLRDAFHNRSLDWQNLESARQEVVESLSEDRISRVAVDESGTVIAWIGGVPAYSGNVWEIHPLVVASRNRRQGLGRALWRDLEDIVSRRGGLTLWEAGDAETNETMLSAGVL